MKKFRNFREYINKKHQWPNFITYKSPKIIGKRTHRIIFQITPFPPLNTRNLAKNLKLDLLKILNSNICKNLRKNWRIKILENFQRKRPSPITTIFQILLQPPRITRKRNSKSKKHQLYLGTAPSAAATSTPATHRWTRSSCQLRKPVSSWLKYSQLWKVRHHSEIWLIMRARITQVKNVKLNKKIIYPLEVLRFLVKTQITVWDILI